MLYLEMDKVLLVTLGTNHIPIESMIFLVQVIFGSKFHFFKVITVATAMKSMEKSVAFPKLVSSFLELGRILPGPSSARAIH